MPRLSKTASLKQVLVYYDGPQLALFESSRRHPMLALAVRRDAMQYPMFACEVTSKAVERYLTGKVDLTYVYKSVPNNRLYFLDLSEMKSNVVPLYPAVQRGFDIDKFFPERGIFSRSHTHELDGSTDSLEGEQRFLIDGSWEARDFSRFYGKIADTYSLTFIAGELAHGPVTEKELAFLRNSIVEKNWQGGGSYLSFYTGVKDHATSVRPLKVAGIEYHSPGYIDLMGDTNVLKKVVGIIGNYIKNRENIETYYKYLYTHLREGKLLRADKSEKFASPAAKKYARSTAMTLASMVGIPNPDDVFEACEENVLVFSKLVLSYCRRVRDLAIFYAEGRVQTGTITEAIAP